MERISKTFIEVLNKWEDYWYGYDAVRLENEFKSKRNEILFLPVGFTLIDKYLADCPRSVSALKIKIIH